MPASSSLRGFRSALAVFLFAAITLCGTRAHAENRTPDSVLMKNGKIFRGTLELAEVDASFFKMTLADGKVITIPSAEVVRIERVVPDDPATPVSPTWNVPEEHEDTEAEDERRNVAAETVHVVFDTDDPDLLLEQRGEKDRWHVVCRGKCEDDFLLHTEYRTRGDGTRTSKPFHFAGEADDRVIVRTRTHSRAGYALGVTMASAGGLGIFISTVTSGKDWTESNAGAAAWCVAAISSLAITAIGTILVVTNPHSKVVQKISDNARAVLPTRGASNAVSESSDARHIAAWRPLAPVFAPSAPSSALFTIHF